MKLGQRKGEDIYKDDHNVDFCRKKMVHDNSLISSHYIEFSPNDQTVECGGYDGNPSVNKKTWPLSDEYDDTLNGHKYYLNKGWNKASQIDSPSLGRVFDDVDEVEK